ncbi:MAG: YYY domain-containing protein histidine kinase putative transcriptional [Ignavibacteria bacterium]|nr:MAG: YYY domain-containing protein histidine kinase putative transcriptional [Ignavibacteria bacterium]
MKEYTCRIQNIIARVAFLIVLFICTFVLTGCSTDKSNQQNEILRLTQWQYHRGDLPKDSTGNYCFAAEGQKDSAWHNSSKSILPNQNNAAAWFRTQMPASKLPGPAVFVNRSEQMMSVYLDRKEIFTNRNFISDTENLGALSFRWYLIPLPQNFTGKYLYFRFTSQSKSIGLASRVSFGSTHEFLGTIVSENIIDLIIGALILTSALVMLIVFVFLRREKFYLGSSIFFLSVGTLITLNNPMINIFFDNTALIYFLDDFSLLFSPFFFMVIESVIIPKYQKYLGWAWKIHLIFLGAAVVCLLATRLTMNELITPFFILLLITSNSSLILLIKSTSRKKMDSVILLIGTAVFSIMSTIEILLYYINFFENTWYTRTYILQWGTLFFVGSLIALAMYRYLQENKEARRVQEQLVKQQKIALEANRREMQIREEYTHQLLQSQDDERKRIAMELHDAVGQELLIIKNLSSLCIKSIDNPEKLDTASEYIKEISSTSSSVIESVRTLSKNLHPYQLDNLGISESLEAVIQRLESTSSIQFKYSIDRIDKLFTREQELHIYRILQELLTNIIKHAEASNAEIVLTKKEGEVSLSVKDNGKGFTAIGKENYMHSSGKGFGLSGIHERVNILHGSISIDSQINKGTSIQIHIPLQGS